MKNHSPASSGYVESRPSIRGVIDRYLYSGAGCLLLVITFLGFREFYVNGRAFPSHPIPPPLLVIIVAHGAVMTCWILLAAIQPLLIATRHRALHMKLGLTGAALAVAMILLGLRVPIVTTRLEPDVLLWGMNRLHFTAIPMLSILLFGAFVVVGLLNRRCAAIHRPMMFLATLTVVPAATDRIAGLPDLWAATVWGTLFGPFFSMILFGAVVIVIQGIASRSFDRWLSGGFVIMAAAEALIMRIGHSDAWAALLSHIV